MHNESIAAEIAHKLAHGSRQVDLKTFDAELRAIGYRLDRDRDCHSLNRYMTGERAGASYPAVNMYVVQVSDGVSAMHFQARRDNNFARLQAMRSGEELFSVYRGCIYEI